MARRLVVTVQLLAFCGLMAAPLLALLGAGCPMCSKSCCCKPVLPGVDCPRMLPCGGAPTATAGFDLAGKGALPPAVSERIRLVEYGRIELIDSAALTDSAVTPPDPPPWSLA